MRRLTVFLAVLAAVATIGACAQVIGATEHRDAVQELCGICSETLPDCAKTLNAKLEEANDDDYLNSEWSNPKMLKNQLVTGGKNISFKGR